MCATGGTDLWELGLTTLAAAAVGSFVGGLVLFLVNRSAQLRETRARIFLGELRRLHDQIANEVRYLNFNPDGALPEGSPEIGTAWSTLERTATAASAADRDQLNGFQDHWHTASGPVSDRAAMVAAWESMNDILKAYDQWLTKKLRSRWR